MPKALLVRSKVGKIWTTKTSLQA